MLKRAAYLKDKNSLLSSKIFFNNRTTSLFKGWFCYFMLLLIISVKGFSQINLIHNPSYEDTVCSIAYQIYCAEYWYIVQITPDYLNILNGTAPNTVVGYQWPHQGNAYGGTAVYGGIGDPNKREYMGVGLTAPLQAGKYYCCEFWVNLPNGSGGTPGTAVDRLGVYFSSDSILTISSCCELPYTPQVENAAGNIITDTMDWTPISGEFAAAGGERFMTVGNFRNDANTQTFSWVPGTAGYYFFDDFSLVLIPDISYLKNFADAGEDKSICVKENTQLGIPAIAGCHYSWQPSTGLNNDTLAQPTANPVQTTTYGFVTRTNPVYFQTHVKCRKPVLLFTRTRLQIKPRLNILWKVKVVFSLFMIYTGRNCWNIS